jgi:hypothetical protein
MLRTWRLYPVPRVDKNSERSGPRHETEKFRGEISSPADARSNCESYNR